MRVIAIHKNGSFSVWYDLERLKKANFLDVSHILICQTILPITEVDPKDFKTELDYY